MQTTSAAILISIAVVIFGIAYYYFTTRHKERMAIIENGLSPDLFKGQAHWPLFLLMLGIICIGIGIGVLAALLLAPLTGLPTPQMMAICLSLFLGISLIICYMVMTATRRRENGREKND